MFCLQLLPRYMSENHVNTNKLLLSQLLLQVTKINLIKKSYTGTDLSEIDALSIYEIFDLLNKISAEFNHTWNVVKHILPMFYKYYITSSQFPSAPNWAMSKRKTDVSHVEAGSSSSGRHGESSQLFAPAFGGLWAAGWARLVSSEPAQFQLHLHQQWLTSA